MAARNLGTGAALADELGAQRVGDWQPLVEGRCTPWSTSSAPPGGGRPRAATKGSTRPRGATTASTYVFIVTRDGLVLFHGADPSIEGSINGVRIFRELIAAASSGGGFVKYHVETESPKVGYAVYLNPKSDRPLIMGSGFHGKE